MNNTRLCISCDSHEQEKYMTLVCNGCLDLSFKSRNQWINVQDRLPEADVEVLVFDETDIYLACRCSILHFSWLPREDERVGCLSNVTQWMPLPDSPK